MKTQVVIFLIIITGLQLGVPAGTLKSQTCNFNGTPWALTVSSTNVADAGLDITPDFESASNQSVFELYYDFITEFFVNYTWSVEVRRSDINWPSGVTLEVRRTGPGDNYFRQGQIQNGQAYISITGLNKAFFNGRRGRIDVPIQYRISGLSVTIPADSYSTTIIYTITTSI